LTVAPAGSVSFTAAAIGQVSGSPTVQWQVSTDFGSTFADIPGATAPTLTFTAAFADNGHQYRAVFTDGCNPTTTTAAMLTLASSLTACAPTQTATADSSCQAAVPDFTSGVVTHG